MVQKRFEHVEDELHKKRAELREALRQDGGGGALLNPAKPSGGSLPTNGGSKSHRSSVTLELLSEPSDLRIQNQPEDLDDMVNI